MLSSTATTWVLEPSGKAVRNRDSVVLAGTVRTSGRIIRRTALDALGAVNIMRGRLARTNDIGARRLNLLRSLSGHQPRAGSEIHDILHMAVENAITAGELSFALETARRFDLNESVAAAPLIVESKPVVALALLGRFDEAIARGQRTHQLWEGAPHMYSLVLCHALLAANDSNA